jgi:hypothetical protein
VKSGFALSAKTFFEKQQNEELERELRKIVVPELTASFVTVDNLFTFQLLAVELIKKYRTFLGAIRKHRKEIP